MSHLNNFYLGYLLIYKLISRQISYLNNVFFSFEYLKFYKSIKYSGLTFVHNYFIKTFSSTNILSVDK